MQNGFSRYEQIRKASIEHFNNKSVAKEAGLAKSRTAADITNNENFNHSNIPATTVKKTTFKEPAGLYNTSSIKRSLGVNPAEDISRVLESPASRSMKGSVKIGLNLSKMPINDPTFHRNKYISTYGYDVLTGVRKDSPNRYL